MMETRHGVGLAWMIAALACSACATSSPSSGSSTASSSGPPAPLAAGSVAPELEGTDQNGSPLRLADLRGQPILVFFYPKAGTPGCTKEACAFRDVWQRYQEAGVRVVGVSHDDVVAQAAFAREHGFQFPLISDKDGRWGKAFGVPLRAWTFYSRISFLIGRDGKIAKTYLDVDPGVHASQVLTDAKAL